MADQARRFEILILRPLQIVYLVSGVAFAFNRIWSGLFICTVGLFYLGTVGSRLHPLQSTFDLAKGPLEGLVARLESELLTPEAYNLLVAQACTRMGILVGLTSGVTLWFLGWRWYFALLTAWLLILFTGALLKLAFRGA